MEGRGSGGKRVFLELTQKTEGASEMAGVCLDDFFLLLRKIPHQARKTQPWILET